MDKDERLTLNDVKTQIDKDFLLAIEWDVNLAYQALSRIMSFDSEYHSELFQHVLETWGRIDQKKILPVPDVITRKEEKKYERLYADMADALLKIYLLTGVDLNWSKETFYDELWRGIWGNTIWDDDKKRAFVLYYIAIDVRIPYYPVSHGTIINRKELNLTINNLIKKEYLNRFYFIDAMDWSNRIERASLILELLEELPDKIERSVFMSMILHEYERKNEEVYSEDESNEND